MALTDPRSQGKLFVRKLNASKKKPGHRLPQHPTGLPLPKEGREMYSPRPKEDIAVFSSESIRAMGPMAQNIAKLLQDNGWIKVEPSEVGQ